MVERIDLARSPLAFTPSRIHRRWIGGLLVFWVLTMILLPIINWIWGADILRSGIVFTVLTQVMVVVVILGLAWGWKKTFGVLFAVVLLSWSAEALGANTGLIFGDYEYTTVLQPQAAHVPLLIPLAWLMMFPPAWAVAYWILRPRPVRGAWRKTGQALAFAALSALAFTAWDLYLDPQMVAWGLWTWHEPGAYFGIPLQNYLGWWVVSGCVTLVVRPVQLPAVELTVVYAITWLLQFIGQLAFWGQPGPAVSGFVGMGLVLLWAFRRSGRQPEFYAPLQSYLRLLQRRAWNETSG